MNDVGEQAVQTEQLANTMLQQVYALLARHNIIPNAVQEQMLTSHVRAMAHRSVTGAGPRAGSRCQRLKQSCLTKFHQIQCNSPVKW